MLNMQALPAAKNRNLATDLNFVLVDEKSQHTSTRTLSIRPLHETFEHIFNAPRALANERYPMKEVKLIQWRE